MSIIRDLYEKYARCVVRITVRTTKGQLATGTAFHLGGGYLATARHLLDNGIVERIDACGAGVADYPLGDGASVRHAYFHSHPLVDLAMLATDLGAYWHENKPHIFVDGQELDVAEFIPLGGHLDDWLGDELVMTKALLLGFPPVPFSKRPVLVAVESEVNAIIDKEAVPHPCFILSAMPRGGFSGGPVISEYGFLLGVIIEALYERRQIAETGFLAAITIEPLLAILADNRIALSGNENVLFG